MGPSKPVNLGGRGCQQNDKNGNEYVSSSVPDLQEQQVEGESEKKSEKDYYPRKPGDLVDQRHDHFRQPFMGCPGDGWGMKRKNVVPGDGKVLENPLSGPDVIAGIAVTDKLSALAYAQEEKNGQK